MGFIRGIWGVLTFFWVLFFILMAMGGAASYNPSGFYGMMILFPASILAILEITGLIFLLLSRI